MVKQFGGLGLCAEHLDSTSHNKCVISRIQKTFQSITGSARRRRLEQQAATLGTTPEALLMSRKARKQQWQNCRQELRTFQCPNCGHVGHNYAWCPFTTPFFLSQMDRFRGPTGQWADKYHAVNLSFSEREKMSKHFAILSMI
jgi:hypothetical protein